jgi:hypothetical protein
MRAGKTPDQPVRPSTARTVGSKPVPETFPQIKRPIQVFDDEMRKLEHDDPAGFRVERLAQWANVVDPYLNPALIERMFSPTDGRSPEFSDTGRLALDYVAHGDPATRHDRFAWVIAHREGPDDEGLYHAWIDKIRYWSPADFDDHEIDYLELQEQFVDDIVAFCPYQVTFDQFSSVPVIQTLRDRTRRANLHKEPTFEERPHTKTANDRLAKVFRTALTLGLVHCPYEQLADLELRFLQERAGRVDHPDSGPVTTNDVATALMVVVHELIGYDNGFDIRDALGDLDPSWSPGITPPPQDPVHAALAAALRGPDRSVGYNPARGDYVRRFRRF